MRKSIEATYDSRDTGDRFHVTTRIGNRTIEFQRRIPDPFARTTVSIGIRDALRAILRLRPVEVTVIVDADPEVVNDVLELDYNTLVPGSTRRKDWNRHVNDVLSMAASDEEPHP